MFLEEQTSLMWGKKYKYGKVRGKSLTNSSHQGFKRVRRLENDPCYSPFVSEQCFLLYITSLSMSTSAEMPGETRLAGGSSTGPKYNHSQVQPDYFYNGIEHYKLTNNVTAKN